jgi:hypothetical protein
MGRRLASWGYRHGEDNGELPMARVLGDMASAKYPDPAPLIPSTAVKMLDEGATPKFASTPCFLLLYSEYYLRRPEMPRWEVVQGSSLENQCSARDARTASSHPTKFCAADTCDVDAYIPNSTQDQRHGCPVVSAVSEQSPSSWTSQFVESATC